MIYFIETASDVFEAVFLGLERNPPRLRSSCYQINVF